MHNFQTSIFVNMFVILLALSLVSMTVNAQTQAEQLFRLGKSSTRIAANKSQSEKLSIAEVRRQFINLRISANEIKNVQELNFPLLDGVNYKAVRDSEEGLAVRGANDVTWRGKIESFPDTSVTLTLKENALSGLIYAPAGVYEIVPQANGRHILLEINQNLFPECANEVITPESPTTEIAENRLPKIKASDSIGFNDTDSNTVADSEAADSGEDVFLSSASSIPFASEFHVKILICG